MTKPKIENFADTVTRELETLAFTDPVDKQALIRHLAITADLAISTPWQETLPSPEISQQLLVSAADSLAEIDWLSTKLTTDNFLGCWALPLAAEYDSKKRARYPTLSIAKFDAKGELAHRFVFRRMFGPLTSDQHLDHLCRVHACCNPAHLEVVTHMTNTRRGVDARRALAGQHPLTGLNLKI